MDVAEAVGKLLRENWSLTDPSASEVYWTNTRFEALDWSRLGYNFVVACYNPMMAGSVKPLAFKTWKITENVIVDIIVRIVDGNVEKALENREAIRSEVYRTLHSFEADVEGLSWIRPVREPVKVEGPDLVRQVIQLECVTLHCRD